MLKKLYLLACLLMLSLHSLGAQPIVNAHIDASEYCVGDLVSVKVNVSNNPGLHSLFFYLEYDASVLSFEDMRNGSIVTNTLDEGELLYANNTIDTGFITNKVVVSFSLFGPGAETDLNGCVAELMFRVINTGTGPYAFHFSSSYMLDGNNTQVPGSAWEDSGDFFIRVPYAGEFILIKRPYTNEVFYADTAEVSLICSQGDYLVKLLNVTNSYDSGYISVQDGNLFDEPVPLASGVNRIDAELYYQDGENYFLLKEHSIRVFRGEDTDMITITNPQDHALLNTDTITVNVDSTLSNVYINGETAALNNGKFSKRIHLKNGFNTITATGYKTEPDNILYESVADYVYYTYLSDLSASWETHVFRNMYLEIGGKFAEITGNSATILAINPATNEIPPTGGGGGLGTPYRICAAKAEIIYKDTIQVFYQKDSSLFKIIRPEENRGFKPGEYSVLTIEGEIDSLYKPLDDPFTQVYEQNTVILEVIHHPYSNLLSPSTLYNGPAIVAEAEAGYELIGSNYIFYNEDGISLQGLSDGEIEITAYKNKVGNTWDDKITRYVYVDNQRLWINLVQPNVFTSDLLDSDERLKKFNEDQPLYTTDDMIVTGEGEIRLNAKDPVIEKQNVSQFVDITEAPDGTLYGLVNPSTSNMRIYKKELKDTVWSLVLSRTGIYGYDLCYTKIGLLVGVSNIPSNGNSGLYLVSGSNLINITFPVDNLYHAQFVQYKAGTVFIYGNLFEYLYSFSIHNIEEENGKLKAAGVNKVPFANMYNIKEFVLSGDQSSAVIRTDDVIHNIRFYNKGTSGYSEVFLPNSTGETILTGKSIIYGSYSDSNYDSYIIPTGNDTIEIIMKNRNTSAFFRRQKNAADFASAPFDLLAGCGYKDNNFYFLYKYYDAVEEDTFYSMERGQVFFERLFRDDSYGVQSFKYEGEEELTKYQEELFITDLGSMYLGINSKGYGTPADGECYHFYKQIASPGSCYFNYINEDIEGITGFEFEVDPRWLLEPGFITFGFAVYDRTGEYPDYTDTMTGIKLLPPEPMDIYDLLEDIDAGIFSNPDYTITHYYSSDVNKEIIHCEFTKLQTDPYKTKFLRFSISLNGVNQESPGIGNMEVFKKVKAKIASTQGETITLPVQGFVYDRTVGFVSIYTSTSLAGTAPVGRNGYFSHNLLLNNNPGDSVDITLSCDNALGDNAAISFTVELIDSKNDLWEISYGYDETVTDSLVPDNSSFLIETHNRNLYITGKYFGLAGAVMGYKLYTTGAGEDSFLLKQGTFVTEPIDPQVVDIETFTGRNDLGPEYDAGTFSGAIRLFPNEQELVIYVENPGGLVYEYADEDGQYPLFSYTMDPEEQEIIFHAEYPENASVDGIPIEDKIITEAIENNSPPYVFTCSDVITGEINALEQFDEVLVKSYSANLVFENNLTEMIIPVEPGNRFAIPFTATMGDGISRSFDIAVIPTVPMYYYLRKAIRVEVMKSFANTAFIPDFSAIHPDTWDEEQKDTLLNIPIRFTFLSRDDIPVGGRTRATFTVNFRAGDEITGFVEVMDSTYYCLKDESGKTLDLEGINRGKNRIQWIFEYIDEDSENTSIMSSSYSGVDGMEDYIFTFEDDTESDPTIVTFTPPLSDVYYDKTAEGNTTIPALGITKDASTALVISLNNTKVWEDTQKLTELPGDFTFPLTCIKEGRNVLEIDATEKYGSADHRQYTFLYDSKAPVVNIASVKVNPDYTVITELTATVKEANFQRAYLHYGPDIINAEPEVVITGEDSYTLIWQEIEALGLNPTAAIVKISATDRAGKVGDDGVNGFLEIERPGETEEREVRIENLPIYAGDPATANEVLYNKRPFPEHTKFAPEWLLEQVSVKDDVEENGGVLIANNNTWKVLGDDGTVDDLFGNSVAISGDYAIVGAPGDWDNTASSGSAYIFKRKGFEWIKIEKLVASDAAVGDRFGCSVAISGNYVIVGALGNDSGSAYIFMRSESGWGNEQKLVVSDSAAFGNSVAISGNIAIIGDFTDSATILAGGSAYIFVNDGTTWNQSTKLVASDVSDGAYFGCSVSISGDYAIVGAHHAERDTDYSGTIITENPGAAYIFETENNGISWTLKEKLIAPLNVFNNGYFGYAVTISGDYANVSSIYGPIQLESATSSFIYKRDPNGVWNNEYELTSSDGVVSDWFGSAVSLSGDQLLIGASADDDNGESSGSAYLFEKDQDETWNQLNKFIPLDGSIGDRFGNSVSISGDNIIVGAYEDDDNGTDFGSAYIMHKDSSETFSADSYLDIPQKEYLVFRVAKDLFHNPALTTIDCIEGNIKFEVYGLEQTVPGLILEDIYPTFIDTSDFDHYVEGLQYLYYMVDIGELKDAFEAACNTIETLFTPGNVIVNRGILKILYDESLGDFEPDDIYVTGEAGTSFSDIFMFDDVYMGDVDSETGYVEITPALKHSIEDRTVTLSESADELTLYFWLRVEDEEAADSTLSQKYKRIVTFKGEDGTELYHLGYQGLNLNLFTTTGTEHSLFGADLIPLSAGLDDDNITQMNTWNLIAIKIDPDEGTIEVIQAVGDETGELNSILVEDIPSEYLTSILNQDASFYFGTAPVTEPEMDKLNTGFFSIASPYYINRLLIPGEVNRLKNLYDRNAGGERSYSFHTAIADYDDADYFSLHHIGSSESFSHDEQFTEDYNADYTTTTASGSLKASSGHPNLFTTIVDGTTGGDFVILKDADSFLCNDLIPTGGTGEFTLSLINNAEQGRYYFGDKNTNYGLGKDRWYSVSGVVKEIEADKKASLVIRINGEEQRFALYEGRFHFIYDNINDLTPATVKVYIESTGTIVLGTDLILNEGNYILPTVDGFELSAASTTFAFDVSGSVSLWYKPFITNTDGFLNYDVVIFDSEYIKIGAKRPPGEDEAVFYTYIKDEDGNSAISLDTDTKADYNWHHLQVSHDSEHRVVYFYINGKIAAFHEEAAAAGVTPTGLPYFGSLEGEMKDEDNVFIGCDMAGEVFAEGYIDNVIMSKYYSEAAYSDEAVTPLVIAYNEIDDAIVLTPILAPCDITECTWKLFATDGTYKSEGTGFPIDTSSLLAGRYQVMTRMKVNGYGYENIISFNEDNQPRFHLTDRTPFLFANENTDLFFTFEYDHSYQYATEVLQYVGVGIRLRDTEETIIAESYMVQDYLDQNPRAWISGNVVDIEPGIKEIDEWQRLVPGNDGRLTVMYPDFSTEEDVTCEYVYFYFTNTFPGPDYFTGAEFPDGSEKDKLIPLATLTDHDPQTVTYLDANGNPHTYEYMLIIGLEGEATSSNPIFSEITIEYEAVRLESETTSALTITGESGLILDIENKTLEAHIYYDDMFGEEYGEYECTFRLKYKNIPYAIRHKTLTWEKRVAVQADLNRMLEIEEFSFCSLDKDSNTADFYLQYRTKDVGNINCTIEVKQDTDTLYTTEPSAPYSVLPNDGSYVFIEDIPVAEKGVFTVKVRLEAQNDDMYIRTESLVLEFAPKTTALDVAFTNSVDSDIAYNDVFFSWKGYYEDDNNTKVYNPDIQYSYSFDSFTLEDPGSALWSTWSSDWRSVRFYNLNDGPHSFYVKATYDGVVTNPLGNSFFVDINKPQFNAGLITTEYFYNPEGVLTSVTIKGAEGAVTDASLRTLEASTGVEVIMGDNGSFTIPNCTVTKDGITEIIITATDRVGNYCDYPVSIEYTVISDIKFPVVQESIKYSPLTIVGEIDETIRAGLAIYVADPFCPVGTAGEYKGWKKAIINPDRTFFVEGVMVNPGTDERQVSTTLTIASVFDTGEVFERELVVSANRILLPIELTLNTHAVEGEINETEVTISCYANVENISSWSIDYNGDGIYDEISLTDNPEDESAKIFIRTHTYSHIGQVTPRVRVITTDGNFFSVTDTLIIHEKIKEASHKLIENPISVSIFRMPDKAERIFVLKGTANSYEVEVFEVGRNETYISSRLFSINLSSLGIENPVIVRALDSGHLLVGSTDGENGTLYELTANEYGNYSIACQVNVEGLIHEITFDNAKVVMSFQNRNYLLEIPLTDNIIGTTITEENMKVPAMKDSMALGEHCGIAKDAIGLLAADYYNQRIIRFTNSYQMLEQFGSYGIGEKEFLTPSSIKVFGNRVFVYDETRHDIQVFDLVQPETGVLDKTFIPVCTLQYSAESGYYNYLEPEFFNDIKDMAVITRVEGRMLYYYALILSASEGKLAMLRLPQWEELRAQVRNNKIAYIKDGEIFTAKPQGSDSMKILSSDSLPRIEGALDYPALSPDGKTLVFTSRLDLYIGHFNELENTGNPYAYDHIYTYDIEERVLTRLSLGELEEYEVERPVFNSNGDKLIFSAKQTDGRWQIYIYDFLTGSVTQLFESDENARLPYYSPDDRFIVFTTDYDGDEDITIIDTHNINMRVPVTNNYARDSLPVWISVYPDEITNENFKIESKIAYVSERCYVYDPGHPETVTCQKGIHYVYISRQSDSDIRVVTKTGDDTGDDPDSASIPLMPPGEEGDYPCFTGDAKAVVFEHYNGIADSLKKYDFISDTTSTMDYFGSARRPAGMKNTITHFKAENVNGDEIALSWNRYTDSDIFYTIQFKPNNDLANMVEKKVFSQTGTSLKGLNMGQEYIVRVCIVENEETVASSQWKIVQIPLVVAKPSYEIDATNPYLIHLHAWKPPETQTDTSDWRFSWIIDNNEVLTQKSRDYAYEFSTSGSKTILLKAYIGNYDTVHVSAPFTVNIKTDIEPYVDYVLAEDSSYVELSCENSKGNKIDFASALWSITGPDGSQLQFTGPSVIASLDGFTRKINVNLTLTRIPVNGQQATDTIVMTKIIDLDFIDLKPLITTTNSDSNKRLIRFSGRNSIGNIDWYRSRWVIYGNNNILYQIEGVSTFDYLFPETNTDTIYTVSLTTPRQNDGMTETISQVVTVESAPLQPQIEYKILSLETDGSVVGQKILFDCTKSRGNNIDFTQARWSVPVAGSYGEQTIQAGPTATYNLSGIADDAVIEVALTLCRQGGIDAKTVTQMISLKGDELATAEIVVSRNIEQSSEGTVIILDVLKSTGPNIDWERTEWLIDNQYTRKGPSVRYDVPASAEAKEIIYTCTLYRFGGQPRTKTGTVPIKEATIRPFINSTQLKGNVYKLDVLKTDGVNIDWERTRWYIHDGSQDVVMKQGAVITHAFAIQEDKMGYPVFVEMFLAGDSKPFMDYKSVSVAGDEFLPVIQMDISEDDPNAIVFSAESSVGSNIDWTQTKWTFLDTAESQYGPVVAHKFITGSQNKSYTVTLTLYRRLANGQVESKTERQEVVIGSDEIVPIVRAKVYGDYLVLSAEQSTGRGLLLDRAIWSFPGEGDSVTYSDSTQTGTVKTDTHSVGGSVRMGFDFLALFQIDANYQYTNSKTKSTYETSNDSATSSNYHTGPICRRYVKGQRKQIVTLYVYRMTPEGGAEGMSITVNVDLRQASDSADAGGVSYE